MEFHFKHTIFYNIRQMNINILNHIWSKIVHVKNHIFA